MLSRLQRKREKDSLKQAMKYLFLTLIALFLLIKFGLPGLVRLAAFLGEIKSSSEPIEKSDTVAPAVPTLLSLPEATNSAKINIAGYSETGATISLSRGGIRIEETIAAADGSFNFPDTLLKEGNNEFFVEAIDNSGNTSEPSRSLLVIYDTDTPELTIDEPQNGQKFFDKDSPIIIKGKTEAGTQLTINGKFVFVDTEGSFTASWPLSEGDNQLDFLSRDPAGNTTSKILTVNYTP